MAGSVAKNPKAYRYNNRSLERVLPGMDLLLDAFAIVDCGVAQAIAALTGLGYTGSEAAQAIARLDPSLPVQELIRLALQGIGKGR